MASFIDLPGELRNNIYNEILSSIFSQSASPPWQTFQTPQLYLSLLRTNKQINTEVKSLFDQCYTTGITLYCDNLAQLIHYHDHNQGELFFKDANFIIRDICLSNTSPGNDHWMPQLLKCQPGFALWWLERTKLYRAQPLYRRMFEERGFVHSEVQDDSGRLKDVVTLGYDKLAYPVLKNGCRITSFSWRAQAYWGEWFEYGSMVLEGKLGDVSFVETSQLFVQAPRMRGGRT